MSSILELAEILHRQGHAAAVTSPSPNTTGMAELSPGIARLAWEDILEQTRNRPAVPLLTPGDIWCVPESWPNSLAPGIALGARPLVYAQSWIYLLSTLPPGVSWRQLPLKYLAVSAPVDWFLREILGLQVSGILPPAVSAEFFSRAPGQKTPGQEGARGGGEAGCAWPGCPEKTRPWPARSGRSPSRCSPGRGWTRPWSSAKLMG